MISLLYRSCEGIEQVRDLFRKYIIDKTGVEHIYEVFTCLHRTYSKVLRKSIEDEISSGYLQRKGKPFHYNYLIIDGDKLFKILDRYSSNELLLKDITNNDFEEFKGSCDYGGKGTNNRKHSHLVPGKQILLETFNQKKMAARFVKIAQVWKSGGGVVVLHLFTETNHYEAMAREFAIIKALGLNNITNEINSSPFGAMKYWNHFEIINYGNMLLYNALKMAITENPPLIYPDDVRTRK